MFVVFQIYKIFGSFILTLSLEMSDKPKKSAKNVVLTDFKRYPVCGMFLFFSFSCPFSCYKALSHLHVLHLILSFVQDLV